jgi:predicted RNase H-like HicB family nuclease
MHTKYLEAVMKHAHYEILTDDDSYYGEIPECQGVYVNAPTLEECRNELADVLEDWLLFRIHKNIALPKTNGLTLQQITKLNITTSNLDRSQSSS